MTAFLSGDHSWVLFVMILGSIILSVLLPWLKKASATNVISASIILIFIVQFFMTSDIFSSLPLIGEATHVSRNVIFQDLGFRPASIVDDIEIHQFITSMFLHSDFLHLLGLTIHLKGQPQRRTENLCLSFAPGKANGHTSATASDQHLLGFADELLDLLQRLLFANDHCLLLREHTSKLGSR